MRRVAPPRRARRGNGPRSGGADARTRQARESRGRVAVGRINATWGLRGHVKVTPLTSNPKRIQPGEVLLVRGEPREVLDVRYPKGFPCVVFAGYEDATAASALRGTLIEIAEADLPDLGQDEYYVHDLVGLEVVSAAGERLGRLAEVLRTGANDVYIVRRKGERDLLLPAIGDVIAEVDLDGGRMVVELLPGLLDGEQAE
ncbi:MAG: ribosome maturation factor RimM [Chloroflexi bacterium]|nr:ribosome maturation factor RimM [Chloroflexota bacterium]